MKMLIVDDMNDNRFNEEDSIDHMRNYLHALRYMCRLLERKINEKVSEKKALVRTAEYT